MQYIYNICVGLALFVTLKGVWSLCLSQKDCAGYVTHERCSMCASVDKTGIGHCIYPFSEVFIEAEKCTYAKNCKQGACMNKGRCVEMLRERYGCICKAGYYGTFCERNVPQGSNSGMFVNGVQFHYEIFTAVVNFSKLIASPLQVGGSLEFTVESNEGYFLYLENRRCTTQDSQSGMPFNCDNAYFGLIRYPLKQFNHNDKSFITLGNVVLGYFTTITLAATNMGISSFKNQFQVFVSYSGFVKCLAVIQLHNCGTRVYNATIYLHSQQIKVSKTIEYLEDGSFINSPVHKSCTFDHSWLQWKVWKIKSLHSESSEATLPINENIGNQFITFQPFTMDFGLYKVLLEVKNIQESGSSLNFKYCYFKVIALPLVPVIEGGMSRRISKQKGLLLDVSRSHDPNSHSKERRSFILQLSCVTIGVITPPHNEVCKDQVVVDNYYYIPPEKLPDKGVYNFSLKMWYKPNSSDMMCDDCIPTGYTSQVIAVGLAPEDISISCVRNCGKTVLVNRVLFLKAQTLWDTSQHNNYTWKYVENRGKGKTTKWTNLIGQPSYMFILEGNTLNSGSLYNVIATVDSKKWTSTYEFETEENMVFPGKCSVHPESGIKGETQFDITCPQPTGSALIFEFYDKTPQEATENIIFNGRMLGTSNTGSLLSVTLTKGIVVVYIINNKGLSDKKKIVVKLSNNNIKSDSITNQILQKFRKLQRTGEVSRILEYLSLVSDILPPEVDKEIILNKVFKYFPTRIHKNDIANLKLSVSTLHNLLVKLNTKTSISSIESGLISITAIHNSAVLFSEIVSSNLALCWMPFQEVEQVTKIMLSNLQLSPIYRDSAAFGYSEDNPNVNVQKKLMKISKFFEKTLNSIKDILSRFQSPGEPPKRVSSSDNSILVQAMIDDSEYNNTLINMLLRNPSIPVSVSPKLFRSLQVHLPSTDTLALQVININRNPFLWSSEDTKSELLVVSLSKRTMDNRFVNIKNIEYPLDFKIKLEDHLANKTVTKGTTFQLKNNFKSNEFDLKIPIHRFDPDPHSFSSIQFLYPPTNATLRVLCMKNYRPTYEMMISKSSLITKQSPFYPLHYGGSDIKAIYYMGVLPGQEVSTNKSINYSFTLNSTLCQSWMLGGWRTTGCVILPNISSHLVHCRCTHFSIFSAAMPVPPNRIDPFSDSELFLTIVDNPTVIAWIFSIVIVYLVLSIWAFYRDNKDSVYGTVAVLEDNFPCDRYPYLLAVFTSSRFMADTTANVGVKLFGYEASSRAHILSSKSHPVLKRQADDWFLIFCKNPLGPLHSIHIWHDSSGWSPDWFCEKIHVYDLRGQMETVFIVGEWIELSLKDYPEAYIVPASVEDIMSFKRVFLDNFVLGMRESHVLLGVIFRHPRSRVTRLQRINVLMSAVMVSLLCSIMFYAPQYTDRDEDDFAYGMHERDVYISLETLVITFMVTFVITVAFEKSHSVIYVRKTSSFCFRSSTSLNHAMKVYIPSSRVTISNVQDNVPLFKKKQTLQQRFLTCLQSALKSPSMAPVKMDKNKSIVKIRRTWFLIAWAACIMTIVLCTYLVVLYGLKLGPVKSQQWATTVILTFTEDTCIVSPLSIVLISMFLSLALELQVEIECYQATAREIKTFHQLEHDDNYYTNVLNARSHPKYKVLQANVRKYLLAKKQRITNWFTLIEFVISLCFVVVVSKVVADLWSKHYYINSHLKRLATLSHREQLGSKDFDTVTDVYGLNNYLETTFIQAFYNLGWYNKRKMDQDLNTENRYWAADFTWRMVGVPLIRQQRVQTKRCRNMVLQDEKCISHWSSSTEDKDFYAVGWYPPKWQETKVNHSSWAYTSPTESKISTIYRLSGPSKQAFDNGGYKMLLSLTRMETENTLSEMEENSWLDKQTRVAFVEMTVSNVNVNRFSQITLILECLVSSTVLRKAIVHSVKDCQLFSWWNMVFVGFILYFFLKISYNINRAGLLNYFKNGDNIIVLVIAILGYAVIIGLCFQFYICTSEVSSDNELEDYFDFDTFSIYNIQTARLLGFLLCVGITRTLLLLRVGKSFTISYHMFVLSFSSMCWLLSLTIVCFLIIWRACYLLSTFVYSGFDEFVFYTKHFKHIHTDSFESGSVKTIMFAKLLTISIVLSLFVTLFTYNAGTGRRLTLKEEDSINFVTFFISEISRVVRSSKKSTII